MIIFPGKRVPVHNDGKVMQTFYLWFTHHFMPNPKPARPVVLLIKSHDSRRGLMSLVSKSLTVLFNRSLVTCTSPSLWKFGKVSTLFKKGDRSDPNNYKPITVFPTLSKILEKAVHNQLYYYLNGNKIITSKAIWFSTNIALTHFTDNIR